MGHVVDILPPVQAALRQCHGPPYGQERQQRSQEGRSSSLPPTNFVANASCQWHDAILVPKYNLQPPCILGKDVANADTLLALLTFNIKYDTGIFSWEGHRLQLAGCYLGLAFTGARPAEFVDREKRSDDGECQEIFQKVMKNIPDYEGEAPDKHSRLLEDMISQEYEDRGRPKALCYEDIVLMIVRRPETGEDVLVMYIRLTHHKGMDNKPKP